MSNPLTDEKAIALGVEHGLTKLQALKYFHVMQRIYQSGFNAGFDAGVVWFRPLENKEKTNG